MQHKTEFEKIICDLTEKINGQYPRPWITDLSNPLDAKIFIVGKNQAKTFSTVQVGTHKKFMDSLFNRNGQSCRGMYDLVTKGKSSPTRKNIDKLSNLLKKNGLNSILETNVICYSTPMSADLPETKNKGGLERGDEIFQKLLSNIKPSILIVHGSGAKDKLEKTLKKYDKKHKLPVCPENVQYFLKNIEEMSMTEIEINNQKTIIIVIPSLAPPAFNKWSKYADEYLKKIVLEVVQIVK